MPPVAGHPCPPYVGTRRTEASHTDFTVGTRMITLRLACLDGTSQKGNRGDRRSNRPDLRCWLRAWPIQRSPRRSRAHFVGLTDTDADADTHTDADAVTDPDRHAVPDHHPTPHRREKCRGNSTNQGEPADDHDKAGRQSHPERCPSGCLLQPSRRLRPHVDRNTYAVQAQRHRHP